MLYSKQPAVISAGPRGILPGKQRPLWATRRANYNFARLIPLAFFLPRTTTERTEAKVEHTKHVQVQEKRKREKRWRNHGCQMAIAKFLDCICLAIRAWRTVAPLRYTAQFAIWQHWMQYHPNEDDKISFSFFFSFSTLFCENYTSDDRAIIEWNLLRRGERETRRSQWVQAFKHLNEKSSIGSSTT